MSGHRYCLFLLSAVLLTGCAAVVSTAGGHLATDLRQAIMDHDDPATVREGMAAWLLMADAMAAGAPGSASLHGQSALLYASYASAFATDDKGRAMRLSARARDYGRRALCLQYRDGCGMFDRPFDEFESSVAGFGRRGIDALYAAAVSELVYIQFHSSDWDAIADLPRAERLLARVIELEPAYENGTPHAYMGVVKSLRPPALGGDPESGQRHFRTAIELSGGRDLMAKVLYAEHYARLVFDRELHDSLLIGVLEADPGEPGLRLSNILAQRRAADLLAHASDYFSEF